MQQAAAGGRSGNRSSQVVVGGGRHGPAAERGSGMRIGVISDTHVPVRARTLPGEVFEIFAGVDLILHAGDLITLDVLDDGRTGGHRPGRGRAWQRGPARGSGPPTGHSADRGLEQRPGQSRRPGPGRSRTPRGASEFGLFGRGATCLHCRKHSVSASSRPPKRRQGAANH